MPPEQPQQNPYDFIMNPAQQAPRQRFGLVPSGGSKQKIFMILGGLLSIMFIFLVATTFLGGSGGNTQQLLTVAQEQQEILRIASLEQKQLRSQPAINLSVTTSASVSSSQQQVISLIGKKAKTDAKILALKKDSSTDKTFESAIQTNSFDAVYQSTLAEKLTAYQKTLKTAYDGTSNKNAKQVLQTAYDGTSILIKSATSQSPN